MAHRVQRRPVRRARNAADRGARALRGAFVGVVLVAGLIAAANGSAQPTAAGREVLDDFGMSTAPALWGGPGSAGVFPDPEAGVGFLWPLAGLARGAWSLDESDVRNRPFPGVLEARGPIAWYDSLVLEHGGQGASGGFDGALGNARLIRRAIDLKTGPRAIGDLALSSGTGGFDGNALWIRRADSLTAFDVGAESWNRGVFGPWGPAGHHFYSGAGRWARGRMRLEGAFTQRGAAAALVGGEEQSVQGAGGHAGVGLRWGRQDLRLTVGRSTDAHESFAPFLPYARRDARENWAEVEWRGDSVWSVRAHARDAAVARTEVGAVERRWSSNAVWMVAGAQAQRRNATVQASLGAGRDEGVGGTELAPSIAFRFHEASFQARLFAERVLTSVWSDLAPGESPFLQSTLATGFDVAYARPERGDVRLGWTMGRTHDRALISRLPLEDLWLREGARRDPDDYDFGLATAAASLRGRGWGAGGEGFLLIRDDSGVQPHVDPGRGARGWLEGRFRAFRGDLGIKVRGEVEVMGSRVSEAVVPRVLPRATTFGTLVSLTLADVVVTVRGRNLADERVPQPWIDSATGVEALGTGREVRFAVSWRFFN